MNTNLHVIPLDVRVDEHEACRCMGCRTNKPLRPDIQNELDQRLAEAHDLIEPKAAYTILDVARMTDTELQLAGAPPFHGPIAGFLKPARRVAVCVVTIGPRLERYAAQLMKGDDVLGGYTLDAIGSAAADLACDALMDHLQLNVVSNDEAITPPFSPGYCGMSVDQQAPLFTIVDGGVIGVRLNASMMMSPVKSVSALIGVGPQEEVVYHGVPCQWCDLEKCHMRRSEPAERKAPGWRRPLKRAADPN